MANNQHMTSHLKKLEHPVELHGFPFQDIIKKYLFLEIKIWKSVVLQSDNTDPARCFTVENGTKEMEQQNNEDCNNKKEQIKRKYTLDRLLLNY